MPIWLSEMHKFELWKEKNTKSRVEIKFCERHSSLSAKAKAEASVNASGRHKSHQSQWVYMVYIYIYIYGYDIGNCVAVLCGPPTGFAVSYWCDVNCQKGTIRSRDVARCTCYFDGRIALGFIFNGDFMWPRD